MENLDYRVGCLEEDMKEVGKDVKSIMTNHLPHIQADIIRVSTSQKIFGGLTLTAVSVLVAKVFGWI